MPELIGQPLGHHRVLAKKGEGGMGAVSHAHYERLCRIVAVQTLLEAAIPLIAESTATDVLTWQPTRAWLQPELGFGETL